MAEFTKFDAGSLQVTVEATLMGSGVDTKAMGLAAPQVSSAAPAVDMSARILPTTTPGGR